MHSVADPEISDISHLFMTFLRGLQTPFRIRYWHFRELLQSSLCGLDLSIQLLKAPLKKDCVTLTLTPGKEIHGLQLIHLTQYTQVHTAVSVSNIKYCRVPHLKEYNRGIVASLKVSSNRAIVKAKS